MKTLKTIKDNEQEVCNLCNVPPTKFEIGYDSFNAYNENGCGEIYYVDEVDDGEYEFEVCVYYNTDSADYPHDYCCKTLDERPQAMVDEYCELAKGYRFEEFYTIVKGDDTGLCGTDYVEYHPIDEDNFDLKKP